MVTIGGHALVLGAGMAGLLAARTLSDFFETVTVVERDALPDEPANRRGVPQGRQLHALLPGGAQALDELLPGLLDELVSGGAPYFDGRDMSRLHYNLGGHRMVSTGSVELFPAYQTSRPFLECHVRRRVRAIANVSLLECHDVVELTSTPDHRCITGARTVDRRTHSEQALVADLTVDATGRGSRTQVWLDSLGYDRPTENNIVMHLSYASQVLRMPPDALHEVAFIIGAVPGRPTGLGFSRCEHDTWMFTAFGMAGHEPPGDLAGMCEYAKAFAPPRALAAARAAEPLGQVARHRMPSSQWRRYDKLQRFPDRLLVVGDAICCFNPVYAQGMTVAAVEALALRNCLSSGTNHLAPRFFKAAAKPIRQAWQLSTGSDLALPEIGGRQPLPMRLVNDYVDRVLTAAECDIAVRNQFLRVTALIDPTTRLLRPAMLWHAATANRRRRRQTRPRADPTTVRV